MAMQAILIIKLYFCYAKYNKLQTLKQKTNNKKVKLYTFNLRVSSYCDHKRIRT